MDLFSYRGYVARTPNRGPIKQYAMVLVLCMVLGPGCDRQSAETYTVAAEHAVGAYQKETSVSLLTPDLDLYEAAFRHEFASRQKVFTDDNDVRLTNEVVFLSLGYDSSAQKWLDPPAELLDRFRDLPWVVGVVSQAYLPNASKIDLDEQPCRVKDTKSGQAAVIYFVRVKSMSATQIVLVVGMYGGPLYAGGQDLTATKVRGKWKVKGGQTNKNGGMTIKKWVS